MITELPGRVLSRPSSRFLGDLRKAGFRPMSVGISTYNGGETKLVRMSPNQMAEWVERAATEQGFRQVDGKCEWLCPGGANQRHNSTGYQNVIIDLYKAIEATSYKDTGIELLAFEVTLTELPTHRVIMPLTLNLFYYAPMAGPSGTIFYLNIHQDD